MLFWSTFQWCKWFLARQNNCVTLILLPYLSMTFWNKHLTRCLYFQDILPHEVKNPTLLILIFTFRYQIFQRCFYGHFHLIAPTNEWLLWRLQVILKILPLPWWKDSLRYVLKIILSWAYRFCKGSNEFSAKICTVE